MRSSAEVAGSEPRTGGGLRMPSTKDGTAVTVGHSATASCQRVAWTLAPASRDSVGSSHREGMRSPPPRIDPRGKEHNRCVAPATRASCRTRYRSSSCSEADGSTAPSGSSGSGRPSTGSRPSAMPTTHTVSRSRPTASSIGPNATPAPSSPMRSVIGSRREEMAPTTRSRVMAGAIVSRSASEATTASTAARSGLCRKTAVTRRSAASAVSAQDAAVSMAARPERIRVIRFSTAAAASRSRSLSSDGSTRSDSARRSQSAPPITGKRVRVSSSNRREDTCFPLSSVATTAPSATIDSSSARPIRS